MTLALFLEILKWILTICLGGILLTFSFLLAVFFISTALYIIPAKQRKIDLKRIAETEVQQRIYLDEYQFTIAQAHHQKVIDELEAREAELNSNIRKKSAELKSVSAKVEAASGSKKPATVLKTT